MLLITNQWIIFLKSQIYDMAHSSQKTFFSQLYALEKSFDFKSESAPVEIQG